MLVNPHYHFIRHSQEKMDLTYFCVVTCTLYLSMYFILYHDDDNEVTQHSWRIIHG